MRFSAIVPIVLSTVALALTCLVLFSGRDKDFLTDVYIIRLNTTNIGANATIPTTGIASVDTLTSQLSSSLISSAATALGLANAYTFHPIGYCEAANSTSITRCTSRPMFTFDPVTILEKELNATGLGITLDDIGFPTEDVNTAVEALNIAYKVMFVTYCIGAGAAAICIMAGLIGCGGGGRGVACCNWIFATIGFLALGIASAVGTALAVKLTETANRELRDVGVTAEYSVEYLGLTWGAVGAILVVGLYWCGACIMGRSEGRRSRSKEYADEGAMGAGEGRRRGYW
ncbi:uncharacterized protein LAJ45_11398 [Morchella importuna]|uniref:SUR7-domain-containing protein n=1 Tax=Morchella conica CCBAS932 TaxID=1392247 RepID=A0A3N4KAA9_9PEZI|nr:uncharacterized protein LAJ45_11398 [Morchella importuna]KAH8144564.1 hypothetical protein LAJ45_11398 [Morchella importuna]RPB07436.1 hypothetical protein P167DRAFT_568611 [Morchella conica CCBAS932]